MITYMKRDNNPLGLWIPICKSTFLGMCHAIGIHGSYKVSHYEVLCREAEKGNEKAKQLLSNIRRIES